MAALRVFRPVVAEGFEWVQPIDQADFDAVYQLDGTPRASGWKPIRVRRLQADDEGPRGGQRTFPGSVGTRWCFESGPFKPWVRCSPSSVNSWSST